MAARSGIWFHTAPGSRCPTASTQSITVAAAGSARRAEAPGLLRLRRSARTRPIGRGGPGRLERACGGLPRRIQAHALRLALERDRRTLFPAVPLSREQPEGRLCHEHVVAGLAGGRLDPRGRVDGVADDSEVEPPAAANRAYEHAPGVHADTYPQLPVEALLHAPRYLDGRGNRPVRVVGMALGCTKHGEHPIADELVRVPSTARHHGDAQLVELVEFPDDLPRVRSLRHRGEAAHVEEQHRGLDLVAGEIGALLEHTLGEAGVHEGAEGI